MRESADRCNRMIGSERLVAAVFADTMEGAKYSRKNFRDVRD
jgi:hypothetical protein